MRLPKRDVDLDARRPNSEAQELANELAGSEVCWPDAMSLATSFRVSSYWLNTCVASIRTPLSLFGSRPSALKIVGAIWVA
jgi:hypothetical protein